MALRDRFKRPTPGSASAAPSAPAAVAQKPRPRPQPQSQPEAKPERRRDAYHDLKSRIHRKLIEALDLAKLDSVERDELQREIRGLVDGFLAEEGVTLNTRERDTVVVEVLDELLGLGPLEPLLQDPTISDILVNGPNQTYVERKGKLELADVVFKDNAHLLQIIDKIVSGMGRRIDESQPLVDARLPDGSRVNAIIPPLAIDGPSLSIRRFSADPLRIQDLVSFGAMTEEMALFLRG